MSTIELQWQEDLFFQGNTASGHSVLLESGAAGGKGRGMMPGELLLMALASCTAMDIVSLLKKFDAPLLKFSVEIDGQRHSEHPKSYRSITAIYRFEGDITPQQAIKAVSSSYQKYSVVANSLRPEVDYQIVLNGTTVDLV